MTRSYVQYKPQGHDVVFGFHVEFPLDSNDNVIMQKAVAACTRGHPDMNMRFARTGLRSAAVGDRMMLGRVDNVREYYVSPKDMPGDFAEVPVKEFMFDSVEDYEETVGFKTNFAFREGWRMARTPNIPATE